ncbi:MAG: histidine phosphatase family protein [Aquihabitans sp.]
MAPREYRQHRFTRPPGSTEVLLVRHGESAPTNHGVPVPLTDGHGDPPLAPEGRAQAELVGDRLADQRIDAIYVTTLCRTVQTAAPLAARIGLEPVVEADLREVFLGEWEDGLFRQRVAEMDPIAIRMFTEERWDLIPGGEPADEFSARVERGLARIVAAHPDQRVAVFAHGGVIGEAVRQAVGGARPFAFVGSDNGSISHLVAVDGRWTLRRFNDTSHLQPGYDLPTNLGDEAAGIEPVGTTAVTD